jgi:hypothetical protein
VRVDINRRISGIAELLARTLGEHIELAPDLWPTLTEPGEIDGAILNLAVNSRAAMSQAGKLFIQTRNVTLDVDAAPVRSAIIDGELTATDERGLPDFRRGIAYDLS